MEILLRLIETLGVLFLLFSYLSVGYIAFFHDSDEVKKVMWSMRFFMWLLSPLVVLDVVIEKIFGRSLLS